MKITARPYEIVQALDTTPRQHQMIAWMLTNDETNCRSARMVAFMKDNDDGTKTITFDGRWRVVIRLKVDSPSK